MNIIIKFVLNSHEFFVKYHHYLLDIENASLGIFKIYNKKF